MKNHSEAKNLKELGKILKLPEKETAKIKIRSELALALQKNITKKNLTHANAAKIAQTGRTVITAIMNGNTAHISMDRLISIAQNLGLTVTIKVA